MASLIVKPVMIIIRLQKNQLHEMNLRQEIISGYISVVARGAGLGAVLFVMLTADAGRNMQLNFISYSIAVLWSYFDGPFSQRRWSVAWFEGFVIHMIGVLVSNLLILIFGNPLTESH